MTKRRATPDGVAKAERAVIRAAMGIINSDGFAFTEDRSNETKVLSLVVFPNSMRRLENAVARLKEARRVSKPRRRKYT